MKVVENKKTEIHAEQKKNKLVAINKKRRDALRGSLEVNTN